VRAGYDAAIMARRVSTPSCWIGFAVILLHNLEEAITAPRWIAAHAQELQARFGLERTPAANAGVFYTSLTVLTIVILLWIAAASRARERSFGVYSLVFLFAVFFCNALIPHIAGAVLLRGYVPGVVTAALLVIPFVTSWSIRAFREGWVSTRGFLVTVAVAVVFYAVAVGPLLGLADALSIRP